MPTNLHALIRYQTLDKCLSNRFKPCGIMDLIEACSEAIAEKTGVYKKVSERTVRDDIRVLRSDILGFNAPIKVTDGIYYYEDWNFSINQKKIGNKDILKEVLDILKNKTENFENKPTYDLMLKIANILDVSLDKITTKELKSQIIEDSESDDCIISKSYYKATEKKTTSRLDEIFNSFIEKKESSEDKLIKKMSLMEMNNRDGILWGIIFENI